MQCSSTQCSPTQQVLTPLKALYQVVMAREDLKAIYMEAKVHSGVQPLTEQVVMDRTNSIYCYIATTKVEEIQFIKHVEKLKHRQNV